MATLHQVTGLTRRVLLVAVAGVILILFLRILLSIGTAIKERISPTPPPSPTVIFGALPPINFPKSKVDETKNISFTVNTIEGTLPAFPEQVEVYKLPQNRASLLSLEQARQTVKTIGFSQNEKAVNQTLYSWEDPSEQGRTITFDIVDKNFTLLSDFYHQREILLAQNLPDSEEAKSQVVSFLTRLGLLPVNLDILNSKVSFFTIEGTSLLKTTSLSNAQIVRVDLFEKPIKDMPIFFPSFTESPMYVLIGSKGNFQREIVEAHFSYKPIDEKDFSTYPMKTVDQAFEEVKKGKAYIARMGAVGTEDSIGIHTVTLGYYRGDLRSSYLMPVFVLEGTNDFVAYVSAIEDSWINQELLP